MSELTKKILEPKVKVVVPPEKVSDKVQVSGRETLVRTLRQVASQTKQSKQLEEQLKVEIRGAAEEALRTASKSKNGSSISVEFNGDLPDKNPIKPVVVTFPDANSDGNRSRLKKETLNQLAQLMSNSEQLLETVRTYTLSGGWIRWIEDALTQHKIDPENPPPGIERKELTRFTADGIEKLRNWGDALRAANDPRVEMVDAILRDALRVATVR